MHEIRNDRCFDSLNTAHGEEDEMKMSVDKQIRLFCGFHGAAGKYNWRALFPKR